MRAENPFEDNARHVINLRRSSRCAVLTQRPFLTFSELQVCVAGVCVVSRHRDAVDVAGFGTLSFDAGDGTMLKTCDSCRLRARGYYTSRRKRKQGEVDKREDGGAALAALSAATPAPPAYARTPGPTPP